MLRVDYEPTPALWIAYDDENFDSDPDAKNVVGFGDTSAEAIADYQEALLLWEDHVASLKEKA